MRREYTSHKRLLATAMGSVQVLQGGHVMVGWGTASRTSKFAPDGTLMLDAALPAGIYSYRALWLQWASKPHHRPALKAHSARRSATKFIYVSWNGATELSQWRIDAGFSAKHLAPIGIASRVGFETVIPLDAAFRYVRATALDRSGGPIRQSHTIQI